MIFKSQKVNFINNGKCISVNGYISILQSNFSIHTIYKVHSYLFDIVHQDVGSIIMYSLLLDVWDV